MRGDLPQYACLKVQYSVIYGYMDIFYLKKKKKKHKHERLKDVW